MKKLTFFFICITFFAFLLNSCSDKPNPVMSDTQQNQTNDLTKGKPSSPKPEIAELYIEGWQNVKDIPDSNMIVHYKVINAQTVEHMSLGFRYDLDGDGTYRTFFDPYVFYTTIPGNGEAVIEDDFIWDGSVMPDFSFNGVLFDQLATANPDQYLLHFSVSGQNFWTYNGQLEEDERVLINPRNTVDSFHVTDVEITSSGPKGKKYQLFYKVTCSEVGFKGMGQWIAVSGTISCCPNVGFSTNGTVAESAESVTVTKGRYRFYVKNLYSPNFSYDPSQNVGGLAEPYDEINIE